MTTTNSLTSSIGGTFVRPPVRLQSSDRLGNFEIQDLMSRYNQAERL